MSRVVNLCIVQRFSLLGKADRLWRGGRDFCGYAINMLSSRAIWPFWRFGCVFLEAQPQVVWLPGAAVTDVGWKSLSDLLNLNSEP